MDIEFLHIKLRIKLVIVLLIRLNSKLIRSYLLVGFKYWIKMVKL